MISFFLLLVMDFETMMHGRENIKYEKAIQQFGHNNPPTPPNPLSPLGITLQIYFFMKKGKYVENQKYSCPLYYNWHLFLHVLWKSYFLDLTISISALNFYKEKWVQTKSQTIR